MKRHNKKLFTQLNKNSIYVTFQEVTDFMDICDVAHAIYFGVTIEIAFANTPAEIRRNEECCDTFQVQLYEEDLYSTPDCPYVLWDMPADTFQQALEIINDYIRSRPFLLVQNAQGGQNLLDPNGRLYRADVSLHQAMFLSDHNLRKLTLASS